MTAQAIDVRQFGERLIRIFRKNQRLEKCSCGFEEGHLPDCPQHAWENAATLTEMELESELGTFEH